jgi:hypothetical protein
VAAGLSGCVFSDPTTLAKVHSIVRELVGQQPGKYQLMSAENFVDSVIELLHIRRIRDELSAKINIADGNNLQDLKRLAALDRYERYAYTNRRRASNMLQSKEGKRRSALLLPKRTQFSKKTTTAHRLRDIFRQGAARRLEFGASALVRNHFAVVRQASRRHQFYAASELGYRAQRRGNDVSQRVAR